MKRLLGAPLIFLCLSLQVFAQSPTPAPTPREIPVMSIPQSDAVAIVWSRFIVLGKTVNGRDVTAMVYGSGARCVLVFGGIHGDEPHTSVLARALAVALKPETLSPNLTLVIVPDVNPDGLAASTRVNANGVDINRNFPSQTWSAEYAETRHNPGTQPASEPETRIVLSLLERFPPQLVITLHAALGCVNWDGPGENLARILASVNGYPLCQSLGYETPGSLGYLMGIDRKVPTVTIELKPKGASELVEENLPALLALLKQFAAESDAVQSGNPR